VWRRGCEIARLNFGNRGLLIHFRKRGGEPARRETVGFSYEIESGKSWRPLTAGGSERGGDPKKMEGFAVRREGKVGFALRKGGMKRSHSHQQGGKKETVAVR